MPCYHPITGYYSRKVNKSGKRSLTFDVINALLPEPVKIGCGRCIGCRLDRSLSWALRCVHEASLYEQNCFVTLTFDDESVGDGGLKVSDFQNFMKRLRKKIAPQKVRFFHCGEYGSKLGRPHHHACLFGFDFPDKILFNKSLSNPVYTSEMLAELWPYGHHTIGNVTFESAAYVARYVMKKWSKDDLSVEELYNAMKGMTVEELKKMYYGEKHVEYITMSRRPGIGAEWYAKYKSDIYPGGFALLKGKKVKPPKFYDCNFEIDNPMCHSILKTKRLSRAIANPNNSQARLNTREYLKQIAVKRLERSFEKCC